MNNPAESVFPRPLLEAFGRQPDTPAFEFRSRPVRRGEVLDLVRACVANLRAAGLGPGSGVAFTTAVTPTGFAAQIAAHLLGCRVLGLRPGLTPAQLAQVLAEDIDVVVADATTTDPSLAAAAGATRILDADRDLLADVPLRGDELTARGRPDDIALITLTSGSTGRPKGCAQTYRSLGEHWSWQPAGWTQVTARLADRYRRYLVFGTLTSAVMLEHLALCLFSGGTAIIPEPPLAFPEVWERYAVTACLCTVPRLYQVLDTLRADGAQGPRSLRALLVAGSPLPPHRLAEAVDRLGPVVHQGYGLTETGMLALLTPDDIAERRDQVLDSVGRPLPDVGIEVRDPAGRPLPPAKAGEIWVRAGGAMSGYWGDPEQTSEVVRDGWIRTRDLGVLGADGFLRLLGRSREVVFINAIMYYTGAIEAALTAQPTVDQAYVVASPDERTGEAAHAFVVPAAGHDLDASGKEALRSAVRAELGDAAVPATITTLDAVPMAPGGKPDRKALTALAAAGATQPG
ncbi:class I adenylate-forming enzyme family protein [Streptomyces sp. NBC_01190]|uniref:class I adenylate-forming enzyme family protein n=1 Tax=Streptomyces sp. NBC_01190 TaxID=2903767 RepID=UPI00386D0ED5|nr:fatty acid--CoA ligase family protein [Streptomyces sp. NBC_01190]